MANNELNSKGNIDTLYEMIDKARHYLYGSDNEDIDYAKAYELFLKAYDMDSTNVDVLNGLANLYLTGIDGEPNNEKALNLYTEAAQRGSYDGFCGVLTCFGNMHGDNANVKFFEFCKDLYKSVPSNLEAGFQTALCYLDGIGTERNENLAIELLNEITEKGHPNAPDVLADIYFDGLNSIQPDIKRAVQLYEIAAENYNDHAQNALGICYRDGVGVDVDFGKAIHYFQSAANQNNPIAMYHLAMMYLNGKGVDADSNKAVMFLTKASELGYTIASVQLGLIYQFGQGVEKDPKKAFSYYNYAYNNGDTYGGTPELIGKCYLEGIGTDIDYKKAAEFLTIASDNGIASAKYDLATLYLDGKGVSINKSKAANLFSEAYALGDMHAAYRLATMLVEGNGIAKDIDRAIEIYKDTNNKIQGVDIPEVVSLLAKTNYNSGEIGNAIRLFEAAADMDNEDAQLNLSLIYTEGKIVPKQIQKALYYLDKLAYKGNALAATNLGDIYYTGDGVPKDIGKAAYYYEIGAKAGNIYSMVNIAKMYQLGEGVSKDIDVAEHWYLKIRKNATLKDDAELDVAIQGLAMIYTFEKKNKTEAFPLWLRLAKKGNAYAQYEVGYCYAIGFGTRRSRIEALSWVQTAITNGYTGNEAYRLLNQLSADLSNNAPTYYEKTGKHCYVATAVYGSYDCPQVWTLRRYRDYVLSKTFYGRLFIKIYYAISPSFIKMFGKTHWFNMLFKSLLDKIINKLNSNGFENTPYIDS